MNTEKRDCWLPPFTRRMWVSELARGIWEAKCVRYAEYWRQIEWIAVLKKIRPCALLLVSQQELAGLASALQGSGYRAVSLSARVGVEDGRKILLHRAAVGRSSDLRALRKAWAAGNDDLIGELLGYPACCRYAFHEACISKELIDCTWSIGLRTVCCTTDTETIELAGLPELNILWVCAGVRMVPHFPCRLDCSASYKLAQELAAAGRREGHADAIDDALNILRWPAEWSCLHGIAEIRTPVLKISQRTDVTVQTKTIRYLGDCYPKEGAKGLRRRLLKPAFASASRVDVMISQVV